MTTEATPPPPPPLVPLKKKQFPTVVWGLIAVAAVAGGIVFVATRDDNSSAGFDSKNDTFDFQSNAEEFIESTEVESQAGTTFTDATCEPPSRVEAGETFTCTAVDADGSTWDFNLVVKSNNAYEITEGQPRP